MTDRGLWPFVLARAACSNSRLNPDDWYPVSAPVAAARREAAAAIAYALRPVRDQRHEMERHTACGTFCLTRPRRSWWQPSRYLDRTASATGRLAVPWRAGRRSAAARAMFERVIGTRHPVWAAAAMAGLAGVLKRRDDPEGAEALYREAIEAGDADWTAHASCLPGDLLEGKGDVAGAKAAWQRAIDSRNPELAGSAFISLVNLLAHQEDADGLRAAHLKGAALDNPDTLYALLQVGQLLEAQGHADGAHAAWQQAIDAGCEDADYWRERMSPAPEQEPEEAHRQADLEEVAEKEAEAVPWDRPAGS
jgi:tetratricopeptide (TPR) repeat protein